MSNLNLFLSYSLHILSISMKIGIEVTLPDVSRLASKVNRAFDEEEIVSVCSSTECSSTSPCSTTSSESFDAFVFGSSLKSLTLAISSSVHCDIP